MGTGLVQGASSEPRHGLNSVWLESWQMSERWSRERRENGGVMVGWKGAEGWGHGMGWRTVGWLGWKGSQIPWNKGMGWVGRDLQDDGILRWVGLEGIPKITEPWDGWGKRGLQAETSSAGLEGRHRSQNHWVAGLEET